MNKSLFEKLGFSDNEALVYEAVLDLRCATPVELAQVTGIKRTTCYHIAQGLCEKGFLYEDVSKRPKKFVLVPPQELKDIIDYERKQLEDREKSIAQFAEKLSQHESKTTYPVPEIRFIEEAKIEEFLYMRTSVWIESMAQYDCTWWGFQDSMYVEKFTEYLKWTWTEFPENQQVKLLSDESDSTKGRTLSEKHKKRLIKALPGLTDFRSTIWVSGDYVVFVYCRETPMHAVEIHSQLLARDLRAIFKKMWEME
jgi:predicted transcriptional regulator